MNTYRLIPQARDDFFQVLDYLFERSLAAAQRFEEQLIYAFEHLAGFPASGHLRPDLTELPFRIWPVGKYLILYESQHQPLPIVAILHGAQNIAGILHERYPTE